MTDHPDFKLAVGLIVATVLVTVLHFATELTPAEQAVAQARAKEHAAQVAMACADAHATKKALMEQGKLATANAIDMRSVCEPGAVAVETAGKWVLGYFGFAAVALAGLLAIGFLSMLLGGGR